MKLFRKLKKVRFDSESESIFLSYFFCSFLCVYVCVCVLFLLLIFAFLLSEFYHVLLFQLLILLSLFCYLDAAELMLLGFISLLLTVFQGTISKLCVPESLTEHLLPCDLKDKPKAEHGSPSGETGSSTTKHFRTFFVSSISGTARRLLAEGSASQAGYCAKKVKINLTISIMPAIDAHLCLDDVLNECLVEHSTGVV